MHFSALLALLLAGSVALGLQIESTFLETFVGNGTQGAQTQFQQNTITGQCSYTDFQDPSLLVGNLSYNVLCKPPIYGFQTVFREVVKDEVRRYVAQYCTVNQIKNYAPAQTVTGATDNGGIQSRRRLLSSSSGNALQQCVNDYVHRGSSEAAAFAACKTKLSNVYSCPNTAQSPQGCSPIKINSTVGAISYLTQQIVTLGSIQSWIQSQQGFDNSVQTNTGTLNATLFSELGTLQLLQNQSGLVNQTIVALAQYMGSQFSNVSNQLNILHSGIVSSFNIEQGLNNQEQSFENATMANFLSVINATGTLNTNIGQNLLLMQSQNRLLEVFVRNLAGVFNEAYQKTGPRRGLAASIWGLILEARADGFTPFLDPAFAGQAPGSQQTTGSQQVLLDQFYVNYVDQSLRVQQYTLSWYCSAYFVTNIFYSAATWMDITDQLGPANCSLHTLSSCNCWIQVGHKQCPAASGFDWQSVSSRTSIAAFQLQSQPQYCSGGGGSITAGAWDGQILDSLAAFNPLLSQLCYANVNGLGPTPPGLPLPRTIQLVSLRLGSQLLQPASVPSQTCQPNYGYVFGGLNAERNIVFVMYTLLVVSQNQLLSDDLVWELEVYGQLPNFLTYDLNPFEMLNDNLTYSCWSASFNAIGTTTRPVFEVIPLTVTTDIQVEAYASLPVCDQEGCIFGTPVSSQTTASASATVPFDFLLPDGSDAIIGEWRTGGIPAMTTIFDTAHGASPLNNVEALRAGTYTYNWQPIPAGYNISTQTSYSDAVPLSQGGPWPDPLLLDSWMANNAVPYNTQDGQLSLDFSEVTFENGQCQTEPSHVMQWVCLLFQQFELNAFTNMRQGILYLQPRVWSMTFTIGVVQGEIIQRVFSGCPEVSFTSFTNGYVQLNLANSLPTPIDVTVRTTNLSPETCPSTPDVPYAMLPKQTISTFLLPCGQQLLAVLQTGAGGVQSACNSNLNITFNPLAQANVALFVSPVTNRSVVQDAVQAQVAQINLGLVQMIQNVVPFLSADFTPTLTVPERLTAIAAQIQAYNASLTVSFNAATTVVTQTALQAIQPLVDQFNQINAQITAFNSQTEMLAQQFSAGLTQQKAQLATVADQTNKTTAAIQTQMQVDEGNIQQIKNNQVSQGACSWCNFNFPGAGFLCSIICSIFTSVIGLGLIGILLVFPIDWCCFGGKITKALWSCLSGCCRRGTDSIGEAVSGTSTMKAPSAPPLQEGEILPMALGGPRHHRASQIQTPRPAAVSGRYKQVATADDDDREEELRALVGGGSR